MRALFSLCLVLLLAGCGPADRETNSLSKAPASSIPMEKAYRDAAEWMARDMHNRSFRNVAPTGSMLPLVASNSIVLLERVRGPVAVGEVIVRKDNVMHTVTAVSQSGAFIMSGINNDRPDGWYPAEAAEWRLAGILYAQR